MNRSNDGFLWTAQQTTEGLPTDAVQQSSMTLRSHYDVIVIGTGFAGLIAARDLSRHHDLSVLLLEARDRIGGRTWTAKVLGEELEMGGTWVHWDQPHFYAQLHRYGLHRNLKTSAGTSAPARSLWKPASGPVQEVDIEKNAKVLDEVAQEFFTVDGLDSRALMPFPHDSLRRPGPWRKYDHLSVKDRLNSLHHVSQRDKDCFESTINTFGSAPGDMGFVDALRWYALCSHSMTSISEKGAIFKIGNGGMTSFARAIFEDFKGDRLFNTAVSEIEHTDTDVTVKTTLGLKLKATAVVSTIPLNCLGDVKFNPPLSSLRESAIAKGHMNLGTKTHFKLRETLSGYSHNAHGYGESNFAFSFSDHNGTQPSGPSGTWCIGFGLNGKLPDPKDSKHIVEMINRDIIPGTVIDAYAVHDWVHDPYAKGAWAFWGPHSTSAYLEELQKPHGRIAFASADWADGWRGFVDGAIEQGQVATRTIATMFENPQKAAPKL